MTDTDSSNIYNTDNYKEKFKGEIYSIKCAFK